MSRVPATETCCPAGKNKSGNPNVGKAEGQRDKRGLAASAECCETAIVYDLSTVRSCDTERSRISRHCCAARDLAAGFKILECCRRNQGRTGGLTAGFKILECCRVWSSRRGPCSGLQDPGVLQAGGNGEQGKKKKEQQNTRATWILRCGGQLH